MELEVKKEIEKQQQQPTSPALDPNRSTAERLQERSKQLEQRNIPNTALKVVEGQIKQSTAIPATPVRTAENILEEKSAELDRKDTVAIDLDGDSKVKLKKVANNTAKPEDIKDLKDRGYAYEVEGEVVIKEGARLGMGREATNLSEKARLEGIRDKFKVTNNELNNSTDEQLLDALDRGRKAATNLTGISATRANQSLEIISGELSRRSKSTAITAAGRRQTIDNRALAPYASDEQKSNFFESTVNESVEKGETIDLITPKGKKINKVVGYNKESKSFITNDSKGNTEIIPLSSLSNGQSRLEIFDPTKSRSRNKVEISEKITQRIPRLLDTSKERLTDITDLRSTPLPGYDVKEDTDGEATRKAQVLNDLNASTPIDFLNNMAKQGGARGRVAELLLKSGLVGKTKIRIGRFGIAKDPNKRFAGKYNRDTKDITINLDERDSYSNEDGTHDVSSTLLHELAHGAFVDKIQNKETLTTEETKALRELETIYNEFVNKYADQRNDFNTNTQQVFDKNNGFQEFAAELLVNPELQRLVDNLGDKTLLQKALQYILNFIQGKELNPYSELSRAWKALNTIAETPGIEQRTQEGVREGYEGRTEQTRETRPKQPRGYQGKAGNKPIPRSDIGRRARQFREGISRVYEEHPRGKAVTVKDLEFYEDPNNTLFMAEDGSAGVAVTADADLVSVFKLPDSTESMVPLLTDAAEISRTLDAYDINGFLPSLYSTYGFTPVARMKFNREFAPDGWTYDTLGEPDIVFMAKTKEMGQTVNYNTIKEDVPYVTTWEEGVRLQQQGYNQGVFGEGEAQAEFFSPALTDTAEDIKARTVAGTPVGTRSPTAKKATESGVDANSVIDLQAARRDERTYKRNAILLTQYPHISREFPTISNRFKEISKPLTDIENAIEEDSTKLKTAKENLKIALAKKEGIAKSKIKGKRLEELIAQDLKQTEEEFRPLITEIKGLEENIANNKAEKKNISAVVNKELDTYVMEADITTDTADSIYEKMVDVAKSNLRALFDLFPADLIETAKLWYDGANILAQEFAQRFNTNLNRASAVLAVFSPQKDWFMNISLAERAMNVWNNKQNSSWDEKMTKQYLKRAGDPDEIINEDGTVSYEKGAVPIIDETTGEIIGWNNWKDEQAAQKRNDAKEYLKLVEGKKLKDLAPEDQARFIRMYSEVYDSPSYHIYSPNGTKLGLATTDKGAESKVAWGGYNTIEKAIAILSANQDNEMEVISQSLGEQHKVRSFYNNIVDPQNKSGAVTMDTHAIGAATFMALSGNSREVTQNFGGGGTTKSSLVGANGLYAAFAEAYRRLAPELSRELGVEYLPREIQSVTWEAVRMLFPAKWKSNKKNVQGVRDIWKQYEEGKKSIKQVRGEVFRLSKGKSIQSAIADAKANGEGLGRPDWATDPRYGTDNIRRVQEADVTRGIPEGGRDTEGAGRRSRGRGGVEPTTGVVSRPTEGGEPRAVLAEEDLEFFSPAVVNQFPRASKDAYSKGLPTKAFRLFVNGDLLKPLQRLIEKQRGRLDKLNFKMSSITNKLKRAAKKDGLNYDDVAEKVAVAFAKSPEGLNQEQINNANIASRRAANKKIQDYLRKNLTEEQNNKLLDVLINDKLTIEQAIEKAFGVAAGQLEIDLTPSALGGALRETLSNKQYSKLVNGVTRIKKEEKTKALNKEIDKNIIKARKEAKKALDSLPKNLKELVLDMRQEIEELTGGAVKDGIIPANAKIVLNVSEGVGVEFTLPNELKKSSPRYGMATIVFESDLDKAAYILANDETRKSASAAKFIKAIKDAGYNLNDVIKHGKKVKEAIKQESGGKAAPKTEMELQLPEQQYDGFVDENLRTQAQAEAQTQAQAQQKDTGKRLKVEEIYAATIDDDFLKNINPDVKDALVQEAQKLFIANKAEEIRRIEEEAGKKMSLKKAKELAAQQITEKEAKNIIENFLQDATKGPMDGFKKLSKALNMTDDQQLAGLPKVFKDALKPLNDAGLQYIQIIHNMAQDSVNSIMFEDMKNIGLQGGWIYDPKDWDNKDEPEPQGFVEVGTEKSSNVPGFNRTFRGLKVDKVFYDAIQNRFAKTDDLKDINYLLNILNTTGQLGVTAFDVPRGFIRQALGGPLFLLSTGLYHSDFVTAAKSVWAAFRRDSNDPELLKYTEELLEFNIIDQDVNIGRIKDAARGILKEDIDSFGKITQYIDPKNISSIGQAVYSGGKKTGSFLSRGYQIPDSFFRASVYEYEKKVIREAYPEFSDQEVKELAAERTKEAMPTYARMNAAGIALRKPGYQNFLGAFIGFGMEVARVMYSNAALAWNDINSNNPVLRAAGFRRAAGILAAYSSTFALGILSASLAGLGDDEEEAARRTMSFSKNDEVIWYRKADGGVGYFSLSFFNPFSQYTTNPIRAVWDYNNRSNEDIGKKIAYSLGVGAWEAFGGYLDFNLFTQRAVNAIVNENNKVYNPEDPNRIGDIVGYIFDPNFFSATIKRGKEFYNAVTGTPEKDGEVNSKFSAFLNLFVGKARDVNPEKFYNSQAFATQDRLKNARIIFSKVGKRSGIVTESELIEAYENANKAYYNIMYEASVYYYDQLILGSPKSEIIKILKDKKFSQTQIREITTGEIQPYRVGDETLKDISKIDPQRVRIYNQAYRNKLDEYRNEDPYEKNRVEEEDNNIRATLKRLSEL